MNSPWARANGIAEPVGRPGNSRRSGTAALFHTYSGIIPDSPRHRRHGLEVRQRIVSRFQLKMAAFAGEQRRCAAATGGVERSPVIVLTVSIAVVAVPYGPVRRVSFKERIHHLDAVLNSRMVRAARSQAYQLKKIDADLFVGRHSRVEVTIFDIQGVPYPCVSVSTSGGATRM
jgi:hypothetical protein